MKSAYNQLTALALENFKTFARRQDIPIRPITLLYGPNSSGKSTVIQALRWIGDLRQGQALSILPRILHRFDVSKWLKAGYELTLATSPEGNIHPAVNRIRKCIDTVRFEATFATTEQVTRVVQSDMPTIEYSAPGPQVLAASVLVNSKPFLSLEADLEWSARAQIELPSIVPSLHVRSLEADHPLSAQLLQEARNQALLELETYAKDAKSMKATAQDIPGLIHKAGINLQEVEKSITILKAFDLSTIEAEGLLKEAQKLYFSPNVFPPRAQIPRSPFYTTRMERDLASGDSIVHEFIITPSEHYDCPGALILDHFTHLLAATMHWLALPAELNLANDPLGQMILVPPTRSIPKQSFIITDPDERARNVPEWSHADAATLERVNTWLSSLNRTDTNYKLCSEPVRSYQGSGDTARQSEHLRFCGVLDIAKNVMVHFDELGAGFSQLVPILLAALNSLDTTVLVQQPEIHLHPALQAELADLFAMFVNPCAHGSKNSPFKQFIIETHSEHLLLRLMRRIRQTTAQKLPEGAMPLTPEDVAVLYIENHGDHSTISEMPINDQGELVRDWPGGFFEEGLRELLM